MLLVPRFMAFIRLAMGGGGRIRSFLLEFVLNGLRLIELQYRSKKASHGSSSSSCKAFSWLLQQQLQGPGPLREHPVAPVVAVGPELLHSVLCGSCPGERPVALAVSFGRSGTVAAAPGAAIARTWSCAWLGHPQLHGLHHPAPPAAALCRYVL